MPDLQCSTFSDITSKAIVTNNGVLRFYSTGTQWQVAA
jgi:hypothetical protein